MNKRSITVSAIIALAALSRLLPHPPNVTPIAAMALFGGVYLRDWKAAFLLPIAAMVLSDLALGFAVYGITMLKFQPIVYLCMLMTVAMGRFIQDRKSVFKIGLALFASAVIFYLVTNFSVWAFSTLYPKTWGGLIACYSAAIPFFRNSFIGDFAFAVVLFGGFAVLERSFAFLREQEAPLVA
jgi:hypothetical protein